MSSKSTLWSRIEKRRWRQEQFQREQTPQPASRPPHPCFAKLLWFISFVWFVPFGAISCPARTCDLRAAPDPAIQDPNKAATLTQLMLFHISVVLDRLGALAIYLRS